jgi:hypothetical protein
MTFPSWDVDSVWTTQVLDAVARAYEAETNSSGSRPRAALSRNIQSATSCARGWRGNHANRTAFDELLR